MHRGMTTVHLVGIERLQHAHPQQRHRRIVGHLLAWRQHRRVDIDNTGRHIGTLQKAADTNELEADVMAHAIGQQADHRLPPFDHIFEDVIAPRTLDCERRLRVDIEIESVDALPRRARQDFTQGAAVFARVVDAGEYRTGITRIADQKTHHARFVVGGIVLAKQFIQPDHLDQHIPAKGRPTRQIQQHLAGRVNQARRVFRAFHVTRHPIEIFRHP